MAHGLRYEKFIHLSLRSRNFFSSKSKKANSEGDFLVLTNVWFINSVDN